MPIIPVLRKQRQADNLRIAFVLNLNNVATIYTALDVADDLEGILVCARSSDCM